MTLPAVATRMLCAPIASMAVPTVFVTAAATMTLPGSMRVMAGVLESVVTAVSIRRLVMKHPVRKHGGMPHYYDITFILERAALKDGIALQRLTSQQSRCFLSRQPC